MMRVAMVAPLFESVPPRLYGGTERVVSNLCHGLAAAGIDVTLFASGDSVAPGRLAPVVPKALRLSGVTVAESCPYHLQLLSRVAARADEFDVIHNHDDFWLLPLTEMTRRPVLTTLHGQLDLPHIDVAFRSFPRSHFVSISDSQRAPMPGLSWVRTIHHGLDPEQFAFSAAPKGDYLAFLGRMSPEKRPEWAIEIARRSGVPLKMAAKIEGAADQAFFEARVKPHIDGRFIQYVGEISEAEKSSFLGEALGLVFPIDWPEPFGLVMIEALACGTPVLARPRGAAPEVLADGVTGYVHSDVRELARRVRDLPSLDRSRCRRWFEERFSLKRMTEDYIDVYRHLAGLSAARSGIGKLAGLGARAAGLPRIDRHRWDLVYPLERPADGDPQDQLQG